MAELQKLVVDQNYTINHEATAVNAAGQTVSAKEVLCAEAPAAILALNAAKSLTQNFILQLFIGIVVSGIQGLMAAFCVGAQTKQ
jgi:hypothetical protein